MRFRNLVIDVSAYCTVSDGLIALPNSSYCIKRKGKNNVIFSLDFFSLRSVKINNDNKLPCIEKKKDLLVCFMYVS